MLKLRAEEYCREYAGVFEYCYFTESCTRRVRKPPNTVHWIRTLPAAMET